MGQIKRLQVATAFVDKNQAQRRKNHFAFALQLAHAIDFELKLAAFPVQNEVFIGDAIGITIGWALRRVQSHILMFSFLL